MANSGLDLETYRGGAKDEELEEGRILSPSQHDILDWRRDPGETLSDWKIVVSKNNESSCDTVDESKPKRPRRSPRKKGRANEIDDVTFHVHKCIIGSGKSEYFWALFRTEIGNQQQENECRLVLDPSSAAAFPTMLDHLYGISNKFEVTTSNAAALRSLADRFGIQTLYVIATDFIRKDISVDTAVTSYLREASCHRDEKLLNAAIKMCAENFEEVKWWAIEMKIHPDHFEKMVSSPHLDCRSEILSRQLATYFKRHQNGGDTDLVQSLTKKEIMPSIDPYVASCFLGLSSHCPNADDPHLLKECSIDALSKDWRPVVNEDEEFSRLKTQQKYEVALKALRSADSMIDELKASITRIVSFFLDEVPHITGYLLDELLCTREELFFGPRPDFEYVQENKSYYPDVIVSGAGISSANGKYTLYASHDCVGVYKQGNFLLCRDDNEDEGAKEWRIVCLNIILYSDQMGPENCEEPLRDGWKGENGIDGPCPTLHEA